MTALGRIGLAPAFSPAAVQAYQQLAAFGIEVTSAHIRLVAPDGSTRDTSIAFPVTQAELEVSLAVPLRTAGQTFRADFELLNADGVVLFSGSQQVVAQASSGAGSGTPTAVQINYTGPGATAKSLAVTPASGVIAGTGSLALAATAQDASGSQLSNLLVRWTTSDATLATVSPTGNAAATVGSTGKRGTVTISAITPLGLTGSAVLTIVPAASKIVVISGGAQTGVAGAPLAQPLVIEVQAADNLPVPGASVTFRAVTAGGVVTTASATADASGRASTAVTLGQTAGVYQFEAASGALTAGISATATAAPAAVISIVSGNFQSGIIGTALPAPLVVKVTNKFGVPVGGATVNWATTTGNGSPSASSSTTASDGTASVSYRLGTHSGIGALRAFLSGVAAPTGEVFFSMSSVPEVPTALAGTGGGQHAPAGSSLATPLVVTVMDQYGNGVPDLKVVWSVSAGPASATLTPSVSSTDAAGNASTVVTLGNTVGSLTITATVGNLTTNFSVTADQGGSSSGPGALSGFVFDAVSGGPLSGATVTVLSGTQTVATVTTSSNGNFTTAQLPAGNYSATITATGYTTVTITTMTVNGNTQAPAAPLVPQSTQPGSIAGIVRDATNNQPVSATVTLELRAGVNSTTGTPLQTVTATQGSSYTFSNVAAGTYTLVAKASGFADATKTGISVGGSTTSSQDISISPLGVAGNVRIVLTWRQTPSDLDSHLTGPDAAGGRFHVYYSARGSCTTSPFACLDLDDTNGNGPETVTITQQLPGTYRYTVDNYSGSPNIDVSGARVDVYINNSLAQTFSVPTGTGRDWTVFELNGTVITPINTITNNPTYSRTPLGTGVSPSRISNGSANTSATTDDIARITEATRTHPKRASAPR